MTAVTGGWTVLPGKNRVIDTPQDMRRGAVLEDDLEFYVTPGTPVDPYTGSVTITEGGEITLPDGTTVIVAPGTTIDPFTGEVRESGATDDDTGTGGCSTGMAGFALTAAAAFVTGKRRRA